MSEESFPSPEAKRPSHLAYAVRETREGKSYFNRIGAAFEHKDKEGFTLELDATPVNGRIALRTLKERLEELKDPGLGQSPQREINEGREEGR